MANNSNSHIRSKLTELVNEFEEKGCFDSSGYFRGDRDSFLRDLENVITSGWDRDKLRQRYSNDLDEFIRDLVLVYDRQVPELYRLLEVTSSDETPGGGLRRVAQYYVNSFPGLRQYLDPDDVLQMTWEAVMGANLKILEFRESSKLKTWLSTILRNEVLQAARRHKLNIPLDGPLEENGNDNQSPIDVIVDRTSDPEDAIERAEQLSHIVNVFRKLCKDEGTRGMIADRYPVLERVWILWNEYFADLFSEYAESLDDETILSEAPFEFPPLNQLSPEEKGQHGPAWEEYLARGIGKLRESSDKDISEDLAQQRTPRDMSKLRAAVRTRRNESKRLLRTLLERDDVDLSIKDGPAASL